MTDKTNEAAERLRRQIDGWIAKDGSHQHATANLSDALAAERQAGRQEAVEEIRAGIALQHRRVCAFCGGDPNDQHAAEWGSHIRCTCPAGGACKVTAILAETEGQP